MPATTNHVSGVKATAHAPAGKGLPPSGEVKTGGIQDPNYVVARREESPAKKHFDTHTNHDKSVPRGNTLDPFKANGAATQPRRLPPPVDAAKVKTRDFAVDKTSRPFAANHGVVEEGRPHITKNEAADSEREVVDEDEAGGEEWLAVHLDKKTAKMGFSKVSGS